MREKNREASAASAASSRAASLVSFLSAAPAMTANRSSRLSFCVAIEDLYDVSGEATVCAAQHFHVNFRILARSLAKGGR